MKQQKVRGRHNARRRKQSCALCGRKTKDGVQLTTHHIYHGKAYKGVAEKQGWVITLCYSCHKELHNSRTLDALVQKTAQTVYETKVGSREEFVKQFDKSWLTEQDDEEAKRLRRLQNALAVMVKELEFD